MTEQEFRQALKECEERATFGNGDGTYVDRDLVIALLWDEYLAHDLAPGPTAGGNDGD